MLPLNSPGLINHKYEGVDHAGALKLPQIRKQPLQKHVTFIIDHDDHKFIDDKFEDIQFNLHWRFFYICWFHSNDRANLDRAAQTGSSELAGRCSPAIQEHVLW